MVKKNSAKDFDLKKRDGREKLYATFDTETASLNNYVYDFGFVIHNKKGEIIYKRGFVIKETFLDYNKMSKAYYADRVPIYKTMIENGQIELVTLKQALNFFLKCLDEYEVSGVAAYNVLFDSKALRNTIDTFLPSFCDYTHIKPLSFLKKLVGNRTIYCIYNMACQLLATQKMYFRKAQTQQWISDCGNLKTNAESIYKYITNDDTFVEAHQALDDALIETKILAKCFAQHKHYIKKIIGMPWKIPQVDFRRFTAALNGVTQLSFSPNGQTIFAV